MCIFRSFVFVVLFGLWASTASAVQLFLINQTDANLYRVDTDTLGAPELLGQISFGTDVIELVTVSPDRLYTFDRDSNRLITISASDATVLSTTLLDQDISPQPRGFDLSPTDGKLYGVLPSLELRTIDPATGITTLVAALTGVNNIEAIAFAPDGTLYAAASPTANQGTDLYIIDTSSGVLSHIGSMGVEIDTLGYASDGFLYGATSGPGRRTLYRINPATALRTTVGDTGVNSIVGITEPAVVTTCTGTCPSYNTPYDPAVVPGSAGKRINIIGKVLLQNSQVPICAMVLANGQYMFSCDGTGSYALNIPLDINGQFKLQVYADGFVPASQVFDEFSAVNDVRMTHITECR